MKTIIAVIVLIVAIVIIDHYDLLQPDPHYPEQVNQVIRKITDKQPSPVLQQPQQNTKPESKELYQWKDENGSWVVADKPPEDRPYKTLTLSDVPAVKQISDASTTIESDEIADDQTLLKQSQCSYFMEQIARYKKRGQFGGTSDQVDQWQQQIDSYQKQYLQNGCIDISSN